MWFELMPHGMREISEDEVLAAAEKIKAFRSGVQEGGHGMGHPTLLPCQMPSHIHSISSHSHTFNPCGGYLHAHCHCCPRR
jgi:hypothetical protein